MVLPVTNADIDMNQNPLHSHLNNDTDRLHEMATLHCTDIPDDSSPRAAVSEMPPPPPPHCCCLTHLSILVFYCSMTASPHTKAIHRDFGRTHIFTRLGRMNSNHSTSIAACSCAHDKIPVTSRQNWRPIDDWKQISFICFLVGGLMHVCGQAPCRLNICLVQPISSITLSVGVAQLQGDFLREEPML